MGIVADKKEGGGLFIWFRELNRQRGFAEVKSHVNPAPSLVTPRTPLMFKAMTATAYLKGYVSKELRGKSFLDSVRIHAEN
ncbi:hypothetical protein Fmac_004843 [Flemingia macrophylla]|uniref:Uncharacterized protein n=1 Tax=Flemingia macrophylla TaxID=520843 RepID=A0ABD1N625_9FABA